jgi:EAL domain-containing protein (putative c-di-GMP-specific phosphodiesterase class I)
VKIDRSFVEDLGTSKDGHAMIRAITTLADALGMETLAEGVEDIAQFEVLEREGCQHIQGFLFSRPVTAGEVFGLLRNGAGYQRLLCA